MGEPVSIGDIVSELRRGVEGGDAEVSMIAVLKCGECNADRNVAVKRNLLRTTRVVVTCAGALVALASCSIDRRGYPISPTTLWKGG